MPPGELIVISHLPWNFVWQRPQHLICRVAGGRSTWFVEGPLSCDIPEPRLRREPAAPVTRVWLEVPLSVRAVTFGGPGPLTCEPDRFAYGKRLRSLIGRPPAPVVWLYTPLYLDIAQSFEPGALVYDVMDDLSSFKDAPEPLMLLHEEALAAADVVFAGGRSLYHRVRKHNPERTFLFPSGVDREHFAAARWHRRRSGRPVAGYVGVIDERLDLDLIRGLAARLPDWEIQMVGPLRKIDPGLLPRAENIRYLGHQPYSRLPEMMGGFDVALMPFALNEATRSISPTKTLEYLAAGLPVVSTRVPDVVEDYGEVVELRDDAGGFAAACREVAGHSRGQRDANVGPLLERHDWHAIADEMTTLIDEAARRKLKSFDAEGREPSVDRAAT